MIVSVFQKDGFDQKVEVELPHGHKLIIEELEDDVVVIMEYPDLEHRIALESIMKEKNEPHSF